MRKKYFVLVLGIAAAVMAGGCSGGADSKTEAASTEAGAQESSSMSDSEKASYYASEESSEETVSDAPGRWRGLSWRWVRIPSLWTAPRIRDISGRWCL